MSKRTAASDHGNAPHWKRLARRVFCLPAVPTILFCVPAYALVFWVLRHRQGGGLLAYAAYAASAYALVLTCTGLYRAVCRPLFQGILRAMEKRPLTRRLLHDERFRAQVFLGGGAAVNGLYIVLKLYYGVRGRSLWLLTLAAYYALLFLMRMALLRQFLAGDGDRAAELRRVRLCGVLLLLMNFVMAGLVVCIVLWGEGFTYAGNLIYVMAIYAFYAVGNAIAQFIRFRRRKNVLLAAVKGLNFVAALVSMLALETAMIAAFSDESEDFRRMMTSISGAVVCLLVLGLAVYTVAFTTRGLRAGASAAETVGE